MSNDPYAERKRLSFEQAEGAESLPSQLQLTELSQQLRSRLWKIVHESMEKDTSYPSMGGHTYFRTWDGIFYDYYVLRKGLMADEFENHAPNLIRQVKPKFASGDYVDVFGFLQFVLRHPKCPHQFADQINWALKSGHAAYRILDDKKTIVPFGSETEHGALTLAFVDLGAAEFHGARAHLRLAAAKLTEGDCSGSVRESISSVESVARTLAPSGAFADALAKLEKGSAIHGGLKSGMKSIYGYTSDQQGIRHPLLDEPSSSVDEVDALFMLGACASFVSYMIGKARQSGFLKGGV